MSDIQSSHGRMLEAAHFTSYGFERTLNHMEYLLTDGRWRELGYDDINDFFASIKLDNIRMLAAQRRKLVTLMAAQEKASQRQIGRTLGVDGETVRRDLGKAAANAALAPTDDTVEADSTGVTAANAAPDLSGAEAAKAAGQAAKKAAAAAQTKAKREASRNAAPIPDGLDLRIGDAREVLADVENESVSLVLTDPPYGDEAEPLYRWLAEWSARVLVPGGSLICYTGQSRLPRDVALLGEHLRYWWILSMPHTRAQRLPGKFVMVEWKPALWFVKDNRRGRTLVNDILRSARPDKSTHGWGQSEAGVSLLIEQLTEPDELIADPFAGTCAWGQIACNMGRRWVGSYVAAGGCEEVVAQETTQA